MNTLNTKTIISTTVLGWLLMTDEVTCREESGEKSSSPFEAIWFRLSDLALVFTELGVTQGKGKTPLEYKTEMQKSHMLKSKNLCFLFAILK